MLVYGLFSVLFSPTIERSSLESRSTPAAGLRYRQEVDPRGELHFAGFKSNLGEPFFSLLAVLGAEVEEIAGVAGASARAEGLQRQLKWSWWKSVAAGAGLADTVSGPLEV